MFPWGNFRPAMRLQISGGAAFAEQARNPLEIIPP